MIVQPGSIVVCTVGTMARNFSQENVMVKTGSFLVLLSPTSREVGTIIQEAGYRTMRKYALLTQTGDVVELRWLEHRNSVEDELFLCRFDVVG